MFKNINLELSLKPFKQTDDNYIRRICVQIFEQWKPLAKLVMTHFLTRPSDFFWPPKQTLEIDENHTSTKS